MPHISSVFSASTEEQIFGSKKSNDFGNTFVSSFLSYGTGGHRDLPNDRSMSSVLGDLVPLAEISMWESKCLEMLNRTATAEIHFSKKDIILATKERKLSFAGALGNVGKRYRILAYPCTARVGCLPYDMPFFRWNCGLVQWDERAQLN